MLDSRRRPRARQRAGLRQGDRDLRSIAATFTSVFPYSRGSILATPRRSTASLDPRSWPDAPRRRSRAWPRSAKAVRRRRPSSSRGRNCSRRAARQTKRSRPRPSRPFRRSPSNNWRRSWPTRAMPPSSTQRSNLRQPRSAGLERGRQGGCRELFRRGAVAGFKLGDGARPVAHSLTPGYPTCTRGLRLGSCSDCRSTSRVTGAVSPSPNARNFSR